MVFWPFYTITSWKEHPLNQAKLRSWSKLTFRAEWHVHPGPSKPKYCAQWRPPACTHSPGACLLVQNFVHISYSMSCAAIYWTLFSSTPAFVLVSGKQVAQTFFLCSVLSRSHYWIWRKTFYLQALLLCKNESTECKLHKTLWGTCESIRKLTYPSVQILLNWRMTSQGVYCNAVALYTSFHTKLLLRGPSLSINNSLTLYFTIIK